MKIIFECIWSLLAYLEITWTWVFWLGLVLICHLKHLWLERSLYKVDKNLIKIGDLIISPLWRTVVVFGKICNFCFWIKEKLFNYNLSKWLYGKDLLDFVLYSYFEYLGFAIWDNLGALMKVTEDFLLFRFDWIQVKLEFFQILAWPFMCGYSFKPTLNAYLCVYSNPSVVVHFGFLMIKYISDALLFGLCG